MVYAQLSHRAYVGMLCLVNFQPVCSSVPDSTVFVSVLQLCVSHRRECSSSSSRRFLVLRVNLVLLLFGVDVCLFWSGLVGYGH